MFQYALCNEIFPDLDWKSVCAKIAKLGYDAVEIAPFTMAADISSLSQNERRQIRMSAEDAGLKIAGLHWLLVSPKGLSLTSNDPDIRLQTANYLEALVGFCSDLGGSLLILGSPKQRTIAAGSSRQEAINRLLNTISPAVSQAEKLGCTLCIEPLPAPEADLILTLEESSEIVDLLNSPSCKTILDVKSASSEAVLIPDLIARYAPIIAHVHANDANRMGPGYGNTDFKPILKGLKQASYKGYISVEVFDQIDDPETTASKSLATLRQAAR